MRIRQFMFSVMRGVVESYGYEEYDGPMLESLDLYRAKTGEEIVGKQLYNFVDKGGREVAMRPEMTPTLARMVASRQRELPRPIRWFSFPNLWRYEQPGLGRLREHWQLNVDIFGVDGYEAEVEILKLASDILFAFGADKTMFRIRISHRKILDGFFENSLKLDPSKAQEVSKILDKKNKISREEYIKEVEKTIPGDPTALGKIDEFLSCSINSISDIDGIPMEIIEETRNLLSQLEKLGLKELIEFDPSIVRGFDYYTGFVYEIFDVSPQNKRSLYGGGRYDNLTGLFSNESISGTGFGMGDVTLKNFLEAHNLLPNLGRENVVCIPLLDERYLSEVFQVADLIRKNGIACEVFLNSKQKLGKQITTAEKKGMKYILLMGDDEIQKGIYSFKNLEERTQVDIPKQELISSIQKELRI
ncbi:MAG: histidine--tRNA ligase [Leptospira sp.]|nr:histidine--tRNA ligase [Leptospira sp.]